MTHFLRSQKRTIACVLQALSLAALPLYAAPTEEAAYLSAWTGNALLGKNIPMPSLSGSMVNAKGPAGAIGLSTTVPFSFVYGGKASADLIPKWTREMTAEKSDPGTERHTVTYTDPETKLQVRCVVTQYDARPAVEWVMSFCNTGTADTPILERVSPLDLQIITPPGVLGKDVTFHHSQGSSNGPTDFLPSDEPLGAKKSIDLAPVGGISSNGTLPFFNLEWANGGLVGAIGWSGQWTLHLERDQKSKLVLRAGQQTIHTTLHPGETIRTPRILLVHWQGPDFLYGQNLFRKVMLDHYTMRVQGQIAMPPVSGMTIATWGNEVTEENQLAMMPGMVKAGIDAFWMDAGWFEGGWPAGAGSWQPNKESFPRGLKPIGDGAHQLGMQYVLWFEPERVTRTSRIAKEHPEWVMHYPGESAWGALFNLGDPAARKSMTDLLSQCITAWGVDVFRTDFNIDPLPFWKAADAPDRQGMAEIRYIEGLYTMWDELRARHPTLTIDNCASGGRRIDLETTLRSYPLWQSDTQCARRPLPVFDQAQNAGLSLYVPIHCGGVWAFDPYNFRSIASTGCSVGRPDVITDTVRQETIGKRVKEMKALRPFYLGDYYPLMGINADEKFWCAWQYDRPDLSQGFVMCFRREQSPFSSADLSLHGLEPESKYRLTNADDHTTQTLTGAELARHFAVQISTSPGSVLFTYEKVK